MARIIHEGKVPMPFGTWEPSRQLGHEGEVHVNPSWVPPSPPVPNLVADKTPMDQAGPLDFPDPLVAVEKARDHILPRPVDGVDLEARSYRLGGHEGQLNEEEHKEVLQIVAKSIIRSLSEEAQKVKEQYGTMQPGQRGLQE